MSAALPDVLDYPVAAPPAPGAVIEIAPARPLAAHAVAVRARSHQSLAAPRIATAVAPSSIAASATPRHGPLWESHFATTLRSMPIRRIIATHFHPDHVGNAAWLSRAIRRAGRHDPRRVPDRACRRRASSAAIRSKATIDLFRRHGMARSASEARSRSAATRTAAACRSCRNRSTAWWTATLRPAGDTTWRIIGGHGHSPEHASLYCAERGVLISGDMLLPKISTNVSVHAGRSRRRSACCVSSIRSRRFAALPSDTLVLPSHGLPFRGIRAARGAAPRAPRREARASSTPPCARPRRRSARPSSSPCSSAASSTCSSSTSPWARPSPTSTSSGARRGSNAASPPTARYDSRRP